MANQAQQTDDYISVASIKNVLWDIIRFFFGIFYFFIRAIGRHKLLFFSCLLLGGLLGYFYSMVQSNVYETEMIVQPSNLSRKACGEIVNNLQKLVNSNSNNELAQELKIDKQMAGKLASIVPYSLENVPVTKDTSTRLGVPLKIQVKVKDNAILFPLQNALVHYLDNNPYASQMREAQKSVYLQKLEFIDQEQKRLDSLKETYNRTLASMKLPTTFYNNALDPAEIYRYSLELANQKELLTKWLNTEGKGVVLIDGFKRPENPQVTSKTMIILAGIVGGLILGLILSVLTTLSKKIK